MQSQRTGPEFQLAYACEMGECVSENAKNKGKLGSESISGSSGTGRMREMGQDGRRRGQMQ